MLMCPGVKMSLTPLHKAVLSPNMSTPEEREVGFIINLPIITAENTDRLKAVMNVGFRQGVTQIDPITYCLP